MIKKIRRMIIDTKKTDEGGRIIITNSPICDGCDEPLKKEGYFLDYEKKVMCPLCVKKGMGSDFNTFHAGTIKVIEE